MAIISGFQPDDGGSIPPTRSLYKTEVRLDCWFCILAWQGIERVVRDPTGWDRCAAAQVPNRSEGILPTSSFVEVPIYGTFVIYW